MRLNRWLLPLILGLSLGLGVPSGHAQPSAAETACDADAQCAQLSGQAREQSSKGQLAEAERTYAAAYQRRADPLLLYERGRLLHQLNHFVEAVTCYRQYLDEASVGTSRYRHKAEQYLEQVLEKAQDLPLPPASAAPDAVDLSCVPPERPAVVTPPPAPPSSSQTAASGQPGAAAALAKQPAAARSQKKKVWQKWWFWTAIGGGAAAIAVGVGLGVASRPPDLTGTTDLRPFGN